MAEQTEHPVAERLVDVMGAVLVRCWEILKAIYGKDKNCILARPITPSSNRGCIFQQGRQHVVIDDGQNKNSYPKTQT